MLSKSNINDSCLGPCPVLRGAGSPGLLSVELTHSPRVRVGFLYNTKTCRADLSPLPGQDMRELGFGHPVRLMYVAEALLLVAIGDRKSVV